MKRCIVIGSMPVDFDLKSIIQQDDFIYCADGGYVHAESQGIEPDIIIGDFDSSSYPVKTSAKIVKLPCEKDDTDTVFAAKECIRRGFDSVLLVGAIRLLFDDRCHDDDRYQKQIHSEFHDLQVFPDKTEICHALRFRLS